MRFWQKIFLLTLTILLFSLNIFSYMFVKNNMDSSLNTEINNRLDDFKLAHTSIQTNIMYKKYLLETEILSKEEILAVFNDFSKSYSVNKLTFTESEEHLYSDSDLADISLRHENLNDYITISSIFSVDDHFFKLTSSSDISAIYTAAQSQISFAKQLSLFLSLGTAVIVLAMSLVLTRRINTLRRSTRKMAHGIFFMRAKVDSHDEIGSLAEDFNIMADTVENKVSELSQIADDRKRFIDNIAHEMKTPLTSIIGFADLLRKAKLNNETKLEYADNIYREGIHLKNVSSKLMEIILLGKTNPTISQVEYAVLLDEVFQSMEQICINAGMVLVLHKHDQDIKQKIDSPLHYPEQPYILNIDVELIKSLLYNLIDNAVKASKPESHIILSSGFIPRDNSSNYFYISVKDFGKGIPVNEINKITEPFYMLDKARTRQHGGAGLGLALCSEIAALHNAELKIESELNKGSEIKIIFNRGNS